MTKEDAERYIKSEMCKNCNVYLGGGKCSEKCNVIEAIKALEPYDFARWVATEIFDENWEYNKETFAELACRKLAKLGIVVRMGDEWELVESEGEE